MTLGLNKAFRGWVRWLAVSVVAVFAILSTVTAAEPADAAGKHYHARKHHHAASTPPASTPPASTPPAANPPAANPPAGGPLALGVWTDGGIPWNMGNFNNYVSQVGSKPAIVSWYTSWGPSGEGAFPVSESQKLNDQGYKQLVTWEPQDWHYDGNANQPDYNLDSIINGSHDTYIRQYADTIKTLSYTIYLRPMHEMNGSWYPWADGVNGNTPDKFKRAWVHIHDIFQKEGATNVKWVWCPSATKPAYAVPTPLSAYYPGDAYVDWAAFDQYNRGTARSWSRWYSLADLFGPSYQEVMAFTNKPVMIAETGSTEVGGDKAAWIRDGFLKDIPQKFPNIKAAIYWDSRDAIADYRVDTSSQSLAAFKEVAASPTYQGTLGP